MSRYTIGGPLVSGDEVSAWFNRNYNPGVAPRNASDIARFQDFRTRLGSSSAHTMKLPYGEVIMFDRAYSPNQKELVYSSLYENPTLIKADEGMENRNHLDFVDHGDYIISPIGANQPHLDTFKPMGDYSTWNSEDPGMPGLSRSLANLAVMQTPYRFFDPMFRYSPADPSKIPFEYFDKTADNAILWHAAGNLDGGVRSAEELIANATGLGYSPNQTMRMHEAMRHYGDGIASGPHSGTDLPADINAFMGGRQIVRHPNELIYDHDVPRHFLYPRHGVANWVSQDLPRAYSNFYDLKK